MVSRQRSASALSQHNPLISSTPSPGGMNGVGSMNGGTGTHYLHDPEPAQLSEIPNFQGNSLPIPTFGPNSAYNTLMTRPRAHTSAGSSPSDMGGGAFGVQSRQPSRNSMLLGQPGMGLRHVSTSVLDNNSRLRGDGVVGVGGSGGMVNITGGGATGGVGAGSNGGFPIGSPPMQNGIAIPPPPPPPPPPPLPKDPGYHPHYATAGRSHGREGMMNYYGHHQQQQHHLQQQQHHLQQQQQQYGAYTPHHHPPLSSSVPKVQLTPLSVPLHNAVSAAYAPHIHHHHPPHHPQRPPPEVPMYRQPSTQSSESLTSFARTESSESDYMTPATIHSTGSSVAVQSGNRSVSASNQNPPGGITRSSHVSHSQQSPLVASNTTGPLSPDIATVWTLDRVISYLDRHEFSSEWQQAFRNLGIHGQEFLEMGQHNSTSLLQRVHPEVLRICGPNADPLKEKQAAKNIKKMVREILRLTREIPNTPPSSGPNPQNSTSAERGESPSKQPVAANQGPGRSPIRYSARSTTLPVMHNNDGSNYSSTLSDQPPFQRGSSENSFHRTTGSDSLPRGRSEFSNRALASVDQVQGRHSPSNSETSIREPPEGYGYNSNGKPSISSSPRGSPSIGYQSISTRHGKSNSTESIASSTTMSHRAGDGKGKEKALLVLGLTQPHQPPTPRQDTHEMKSSGTKFFEKVRKRIRKESKDEESMGNEDDSPTSPSWRSGVPNLPFAIPENNTSDSSLDRHSISSVDGLRGRQKNMRLVNGTTGAGNQTKKFVFVTKDGRIWVLVDVTNLETVDILRKVICGELGISEWEYASIHLTEVGHGPSEEPLTDHMLNLSCRTKGDPIASLKFYVCPTPMSAYEPMSASNEVSQGLNSPAQLGFFNSEQPRGLQSNKPQPIQVERAKNQLDRRPPSSHLASESSTLKQGDFAKSLERPHESQSSPPQSAHKDEMDDLLERLKLLRSYQDLNSTISPQINVIGTPNSPHAPAGPHPSIQPSPNDSVPDPSSAYPRGEWGDFSGLKPMDLRLGNTASPIDGGLTLARHSELFFEEDRSPITGFNSLNGPHKGSAGTSQLEAAAQSHRIKLDTIAQQQQREMAHKNLKKAEQAGYPGFTKINTTRTRVVDFDNPRSSPYEDKQFDLLIPQRKPPPPPSKRNSVVSLGRRDSMSSNHSWLPDERGSNVEYPTVPRRASVYRRRPQPQHHQQQQPVPEMSEVGTRRKAVPPARTDEPSRGFPATSGSPIGIGSSLLTAGMMSAGITRTPIPFIPRELNRDPAPSASTVSLPTYPNQQQQSHEPSKQQRAIATVNFGESGSSSPRSGGTPSSPGFTWGKGNQLFKIPDYQPETEAGPEKLTLQIPVMEAPRQASPEISPGDRDVPLGIRKSTFGKAGGEILFKENEVQFDPNPGFETSVVQEEEDSDEDDGLFAIPISSRGEKQPKVEFPKVEPEPERQADSPRPTLTIATKNVTFRPTPTTPATASTSATTTHSPPTPEFEEGDDKLGLNSPAGYHNMSAPGSAAASTHSPADYMRIGRRDSFNAHDNWASRPPPEALINHLDEFFPNLDLDQPIIDETVNLNMSPPVSPVATAENEPRSYQLTDNPASGAAAPEASAPADAATVASDAPPTLGSPQAVPRVKQTVPAVAQRNLGRSQIGRMKSIREVAKGAHEQRKRFTNPNLQGVKNSDILRRKSTKLFGAKLIEVKPGEGKRGAMHQQQLAAQQPQQPQLQQQLGGIKRQATFKWFKGQLIGKGTYGRVYLGMNATTGEFLAVKQVEVSKHVSTSESDRQKEMIAALNQEIETMQHLDHVNIVQYLGCERKELNMSIFLEYISGGSVGSCLRKHGRFEEPVVRSLTRQTLSGLEYLHREGILHRDLKADNILLDVDGTCKISDFGISKRSDNIYGDDPGNSMQGSVFWMAPEVIRPERQGYSAKIDIWSLGCVVLEMFAGRRPWSKEEVIGAIYKLGSERQAPPVPDDVAEVISPSAIGFLADCHTIEPSERPTAATLLNEHEFCSLDPNFNFLDTSLYMKIRGAFAE